MARTKQNLDQIAKKCSEVESLGVPRQFNDTIPILIEEIQELMRRVQDLES